MIKLTDIIKELGINNPNNLIPGKKYYIPWNNKVGVYRFVKETGDGRLIFINKYNELNLNKDNYVLNKEIKPYKEDVIKVEPYVVNELQINNPNLTAEEVIDFWDGNININDNYRDIKKKYCLEYSINSSIDSEDLIRMLPKIGLNQFYKDLKELYRLQQQKLRPNNINNLAELQINKPSLFNRLKEDGYYLISWNNNGTIETEKIKVLGLDGDEDEYWVNIQILSNVKKWNKILGFEGDLDQTPWIQLFPEDLISLKPLND